MVDFTGGTWRSLIDGSEVSAIPDSGGDHQWNTNEGGGTTLTDSIGDLNGSINGPSWETGGGTHDVYLFYDGSDDYVDLGSQSQSALSSVVEAPATICAWIYVSEDVSSDRLNIFATETTSNGNNFNFQWREDNNEFWLQVAPDDFRLNGGSITYDEWIPTAFTISSSEGNLYVGENMDNVDSGAYAPSSGDLEHNVKIGGESDSLVARFYGGIDLSFYEEREWSRSELQDWVDDTKKFYE